LTLLPSNPWQTSQKNVTFLAATIAAAVALGSAITFRRRASSGESGESDGSGCCGDGVCAQAEAVSNASAQHNPARARRSFTTIRANANKAGNTKDAAKIKRFITISFSVSNRFGLACADPRLLQTPCTHVDTSKPCSTSLFITKSLINVAANCIEIGVHAMRSSHAYAVFSRYRKRSSIFA